jgi:hypothetical protein
VDISLGSPSQVARALAAAVRCPRALAALVAIIVRTPSERVPLSRSPAGESLREYFDQRSLGAIPRNRLCRGVLLLPAEHSDYIRGRRRQALRTNLRRAERAGIRCQPVEDPELALRAAREVMLTRQAAMTQADLASLTGAWPDLFARPEVALMVACDRGGRPCAVMAVVIDTAISLIEVAVASSHDGRWALHDFLVRTLIGRKVEYLLAEGCGPFGAIGFEHEIQHYQHLLGYALRHIIPLPS